MVDFLHPHGISQLMCDFLNTLPIIANGILRKRLGISIRCVKEKAVDFPRQPSDLIVRHCGTVSVGEKFPAGDHGCDPLGNPAPAHLYLGIGFGNAAVTERQAFSRICAVIVAPVIAAVLTVQAFQMLFPFLRILIAGKERVDAQTIITVVLSAAQHLVDLIGGNKKSPLRVVILGRGKGQGFSL